MTEIEAEKIVTEHVYPPIPYRSADWSATRGDYDLGAKVGWGSTEAEAVADLLELEEADE
jgi:hypothetical protein